MNEEIIIPTLSLWQPWAAALVTEHPKYPGTAIKIWETRSWKIPPKFIGKRLLVHAAKKDDSENSPFIYRLPFSDYRSILSKAMLHGAIIGSVIVKDCISTEDWMGEYNTGRWSAEEIRLGDYRVGRYAWECVDFIYFPEPIAARGYQKIYGTPISKIPSQYHHLFQ